MSDSSTLQVVVDAAPAEAGASRVKNAISSMSSSATSALNSLSSSFERMQSFLSKSNAGLTAFFAAIGAGYVLKSFLDRLIEVNTTFNAFIATMNVVTGSVAKSNAEYQYLLAFSNKIGVSIESVTKQYGRLAASMKSVDETGEMTRHVFEAISEASTVLHLKGYETNLLFMALEQSASKGKVSLEEFQRQLANKLPDAMGLASRSMNMTQAEFRDAVKKGTLNVYEVLIKLSNQIKKEYGESAEYAANQFTGKLNIMKNSIFELYRVMGQSGAMDGLTKIIATITDKLGDSSLGKTIGDSLGVLFGQLADWLSKITQSDVQDFFLGLSGIIQSFTVTMRELVGAFSQTVDGKSDFIGFSETVAKMMIIMTDAAMTFLAVIMQLPLSINVVIQDVNVMLAGLKGIKDWATDGLDAAANNINAAKAERDKAKALEDTNLAILLGSDDSPTAKAWKKTDEIFANMRKQKAAMEADNKALAGKTQIDIRPKTEAEMANMMKGLPPTPAKPNKGMESAYEQERVRLFKTAGVAELEYTNIMEGRLKTEGKIRTELEAKMRFDKDYIAMSKAQKAELLSMADAADKATAKRVAAEQFQSDILSMNKAIYQSEMDLMDVANNRNPIEEKNLRQFEERLKFDSKYLAMSSQMIEAEREKAKAADALAVSVESARKAQAYHNATLMQSLDIQRQIEQMKGGNYVSKYTNESQMEDSFKTGGENQFTSEADQQKMLNDARQRDRDLRARDVAQIIADSKLSLDQMRFELQMQGQQEKAIKQATEARKIELDVKKLSAGATGDELAAYQQLEQFLKVQMNAALDEYYAKQATEAAAAEWQKTVDRIDQTFHDGFVGMLEKGKADWESFADSIANTFKTAVADEIYKMTIKPMVMQVVGSFAGTGTGAAGSGATGVMGVVSNVSNAYNGISSGITNAASSFATSGMGQYLGLSSTAPIATNTSLGSIQLAGTAGSATGGAYLTNSGSSFVAGAAPYAAAISALAYGDHLMKAGWGLDNNRKGYAASAAGAVAGGMAAGASTGAAAGSSVGPVGTAVGAVVGAIAVPVLDRLFGHNNKTNADAAGIQGTFDLSGFSGDQWQQFSKKGGTFRSDRRWTDTYDVSSDIDKELDSAFRKTVAKLQDIGKTLGVETSKSIDGFTHEFSLQLSDNGDMSKAGEKLAAEIGRAADELVAKMVPNIDEFARLGESASQTFGRLNQEVAATDAILLAMGKNAAEAFGGVGLASIAAREHLIDLAGGLESLASKTQSFYANFYTGEEQVQLAAKQAQKVLTEGFAELGQGIPATREAFRALVESQDLSTEAGRKLWNSLLDLQDEFDAVADGADATAASMKAAADKLAAATTTAQQGQASMFDTFASDAQKLDAAKKIVNDTFASIGKAVPESAAAFLSLAQSIDPATEAGQSLIAALNKISGAFAYVQTTAAAAAKATLAGQASKIEYDMQSLVERFGSLSPAARTVADDLAATQQQLAGLSDGLANLFNTAQLTDLQKLGQTVGYRDQIRGAISQLNDDVFEAMLKGMARPQQIEQLKKAEADLWAGMSAAADKGQQASKIRAVVLRRLGLESDEVNSAASKAADLAKQARQDQIETLRTQIDGMQRMRDLAGQIADFTDNLSIGDLSPLSYTDQLASAKSLFEQTLAAAQIGDTQAQGQLIGNARTYLDEARSYFASSTDYAAVYEKVTGSLKGFAAPSDSALTTAQAQLDTLAKLPEVMAAVVDNSKNDVAALQAVQLALRNGDDYLSKSIDAQTVALQKQIDALTTIASNQEAQIRQAGTAYQQMTDELKAVKAQLAAIEANGALAGAA